MLPIKIFSVRNFPEMQKAQNEDAAYALVSKERKAISELLWLRPRKSISVDCKQNCLILRFKKIKTNATNIKLLSTDRLV